MKDNPNLKFEPTATFEIHADDKTNLGVIVYDGGEAVSLSDVNYTTASGNHPEVLIGLSGLRDLLLKLRESGMEI